MANFEVKTVREIYNQIISKYTALRNKYKDTTPLLEKAVIKSLAWAFAGVASSMWRLAVWVYKQCFPQTAGLTALKFWGNLVGVRYKYGEPTSLTIELTEVSAASLRSGTTYKHLTTGLIYKTISGVNASNGIIIATAQCSTAGIAGNIPVGSVLQISNPFDGIPSTATVTGVAIQGTADELLEDYRKRVLYKFRKRPQGGAATDYFDWALEVPAIADCFPYVREEGTVDLFLVTQGSGMNRTPTGTVSPNPFPNWVNGQPEPLSGSGTFFQAANAINSSDWQNATPGSPSTLNDRRPIQVPVRLNAPNYMAYSIAITGMQPADTATINSIRNQLVAYMDSKRPNIPAIGYSEQNAVINANRLSAIVQNILTPLSGSFSNFALTNASNEFISSDTLGVGALAYIQNLTINGINVSL